MSGASGVGSLLDQRDQGKLSVGITFFTNVNEA